MAFPPSEEYEISLRVGDPDEVRLLRGDLTKYPADAIVNAANSNLLPGGGVCGAIHLKGGPEIARECERLLRNNGPVPPGKAVATTAGALQAKHVIHAVGPVWKGGSHGEAKLLASAYRESMRVADDLGLYSIAFPAISTGIFGYPLEAAADIAVGTVAEALKSARHLVFAVIILFDKAALDVFAKAALELVHTHKSEYSLLIGIFNA